MSIVDETRALLRIDRGLPTHEWEIVTEQIEKSPVDRSAILEGVFADSLAFWDTRAKAGLELLAIRPSAAWHILDNLIKSNDPDDHGTALSFLEDCNDPRAPRLALSLLAHSELQEDVERFLGRIDPAIAQSTLRQFLMQGEGPMHQRAQQLLSAVFGDKDKLP